MRIAAIITGQSRHFWYTLPSVFERVIKPNNIDCYVMHNHNSAYNYQPDAKKKHYMDEDFIYKDIIGDRLKYINTDKDKEYQRQKQYHIKMLQQRTEEINLSNYGKCNFWFYRDVNTEYMVDQWLKVAFVSNVIEADKYDMINRIRPDIPFFNTFMLEPSNDIRIYYEDDANNLTPWTKENIFYGGANAMKYVCENFIVDMWKDRKSWRRGNEELCLINEIQFGKFLYNNKIAYSQINKKPKIGRFYNFHNLHKSKYYHLANAKDMLTCYVDGGSEHRDLINDDIYTLY